MKYTKENIENRIKEIKTILSNTNRDKTDDNKLKVELNFLGGKLMFAK
jgi:hypothetical protein